MGRLYGFGSYCNFLGIKAWKTQGLGHRLGWCNLPQHLIAKLESAVSGFALNSNVSELELEVTNPTTGLKFKWKSPESRTSHLIASSTKMFASTVVQQLVDERKLDLSDSISKHLPRIDYSNLNVADGVDYSDQVTVRDLLSHTSGIADYYQMKRLPKTGNLAQLSEQDPGWNFKEAIAIARQLPARFPPNSGKAHYSFTNYQLVGRLIEAVTTQTLSEVFKTRIFEPLELNQTSLLTPGNLEPFYTASSVLIGKQKYLGARRIASLGAEGAIVSSTGDVTKFLNSFFSGEIISEAGRENLLANWLPIFPGIRYSAGVMSLGLPRIATGAAHRGRYLGHSGATGHFMFYDPIEKLTIVGTTNQLKPSTVPYRLMTSVLRAINSN
jgi:D-alanyl-D-alanine carboxypeptidase